MLPVKDKIRLKQFIEYSSGFNKSLALQRYYQKRKASILLKDRSFALFNTVFYIIS
jgi:hypothetical protein